MNREEIEKRIENKYSIGKEILEYDEGHCKNVGKDANIMKNPLWRF